MNTYDSPNYSYDAAMAAIPSVKTPTAGLASIADALINGYFNPNGPQQQRPMQLQGAVAPASTFLASLFNGGPPSPGNVTPDPSTAGGLY